MPDPSVLAIDAGQTGIRTLLTGSGAGRHREFDGIRTDSPLIPQLADIVTQVSADGGEQIDIVAAGVSGLTSAETDPELLRRLTAGAGVRAAYLTHDSVSSYLGALGDETGAVIAVGTGVVTLAVGRESVARIDGWGNLIGDAGSGYWIGRAAFDSVLRAHDGRGPQTILTDIVQTDFPDLETAYIELQSDPNRVSRIASYARLVSQVAETDEVAAKICHAAAAELANSVSAGLRRTREGASTAPAVCAIGRVMASSTIAHHFAAALQTQWPQVSIKPPQATSLDGVALLPRLTQSSPLRTLVASADEYNGDEARHHRGNESTRRTP